MPGGGAVAEALCSWMMAMQQLMVKCLFVHDLACAAPIYPLPAGDVATWSGVVTGGLMLLSPLLFERLGWRGVAGATPKILLYGGSAFFLACIVYQVRGAGMAVGC